MVARQVPSRRRTMLSVEKSHALIVCEEVNTPSILWKMGGVKGTGEEKD